MDPGHLQALAPTTSMRERLLAQLRWLMGSPVGAVLGALVYGSWAFYINYDAGLYIALRSGLVHWAMSASLTYSGAASMRLIFTFGRNNIDSAVLACLGGLCFTYSVLIGVHHFIGTPHILWTLAPGVLPTIAFCVTYAVLLARARPDTTTGIKNCS